MISIDLLFDLIKRPHRVLYLSLYKIGFISKPKTFSLSTFYGDKMVIVLPEIVSSILYLTGRYEKDVEQIFLRLIHDTDTVLDIGAHFGYYTLLSSHLVGKKGKVYAFEPTPSTYKILLRNVKYKRNVTCVNKAVYQSRKYMKINDYGVVFSALNSFYNPRIDKKLSKTQHNIATITLDTFCKQMKIIPYFIKIDAESSEYQIIIGASKILHDCKPIICMEIGDMGIKDVVSSRNVIAYLDQLGYKSFMFNDGSFKELCFDKNIKYGNAVFIHKTKLSKLTL